ncbi:hypothetical protein B0H21DRAFT_824446 [Amylocystis lapponica]|nr:hypothetical protein B0H21DRAFT_828390 [Amylocystis lapponica]KAH9941447.1 hypothetical protein B0H21DRAFT_824446 [Amylocystis lapponica]
MDDLPLLPTRRERARPVPIEAPRPTLPPESFQAILQCDWNLTRAMRIHNDTKEEQVTALVNFPNAPFNSTWAGSQNACSILPKETHATDGINQLWSSDPATSLSPPSPSDLQPPERQEREYTTSMSSWMNCLQGRADFAALSPAIHSDAAAADQHVSINIDACIQEATRMVWRQEWLTFIRRRVQRRLQDAFVRDEDNPAHTITPNRLGAHFPLVETPSRAPAVASLPRRRLFQSQPRLSEPLDAEDTCDIEGQLSNSDDCGSGWLADDENDGP